MLPVTFGPVHPDVLYAYQTLGRGANEAELAKLYRLAAIRRRINLAFGATLSLVLYNLLLLRLGRKAPYEVKLSKEALRGLLLGTYFGSIIYPIGVHPLTRMLERVLVSPVSVAASALRGSRNQAMLEKSQVNQQLLEPWFWAAVRSSVLTNVVGLAMDLWRYGYKLTPVREDPSLAVKILSEYPPPPTSDIIDELIQPASKPEESMLEIPESADVHIPDIGSQNRTTKSERKN